MDKIMDRVNLKAVFIICMIFVPCAHASGGGQPADSMTWVWATINFSILVFVLSYFLKKPLSAYLSKRTEIIEQSLNEAREAKKFAQKALAEIEDKLKLKDDQIERIISSAQESGEREKTRLVEEAKMLTDKLKELTDKNIAYELKKAKDELRQETAKAVIDMAEAKIKNTITNERQHKLVQDSIDKLRHRN